ncbi:MAG: GTPase ObgE [bacterium]
MFVDQAKIFVQAGNGGNGCVSFRREKFIPRGGPDGGDGGKGGNVLIVASSGMKTLLDFSRQPHYRAQNGAHGSGNNRSGKAGSDLILKVPWGTLVYKGEEVICDLVNEGQSVIVARGGRGGRGNAKFKSPSEPLPRFAKEGEVGESATLRLELKLIAQVGLLGYPNAGKSTLLSAISSARPKIADYPFTTLVPNLGLLRLGEGESFAVADIPGLIADAHKGKGLGDQFLRHIERTEVLVHLVDIQGYEGASPFDNYMAINAELKAFNPKLLKKPQIIVVNKMDIPSASTKLRTFRSRIRKKVYPISALTREGIKELLHAIRRRLKK